MELLLACSLHSILMCLFAVALAEVHRWLSLRQELNYSAEFRVMQTKQWRLILTMLFNTIPMQNATTTTTNTVKVIPVVNTAVAETVTDIIKHFINIIR